MDGDTLKKDKHNRRFNFIQANNWTDKINTWKSSNFSERSLFFLFT